MDSARLQLLQELMKEAGATGELESSLAATSVMPMSKRPTRKNVQLADFNHAVANMAKPSACVQPSGIQSAGIQAPGIQAVPKSTLLADVPASSNAPPMSQGLMALFCLRQVCQCRPSKFQQQATNLETSQGINRMRLAQERRDPLPTVEETRVQRAKAAIFRSNLGQTVDSQVVAKALATLVEAPSLSYPPSPGYRSAGYMKSDPPATLNKKSRVTRRPVQVSLQTAIPEGDEEDDKPTSWCSRYQSCSRPPMGTWQEPVNVAARHRRANSHCLKDVMSYGEWRRAMIEFGKEMRGGPWCRAPLCPIPEVG